MCLCFLSKQTTHNQLNLFWFQFPQSYILTSSHSHVLTLSHSRMFTFLNFHSLTFSHPYNLTFSNAYILALSLPHYYHHSHCFNHIHYFHNSCHCNYSHTNQFHIFTPSAFSRHSCILFIILTLYRFHISHYYLMIFLHVHIFVSRCKQSSHDRNRVFILFIIFYLSLS